ncbi:MAG: sigma-70 family RNA polymerase sigma factor [Cyanobacteria bacterium P01_F01_bin.150]
MTDIQDNPKQDSPRHNARMQADLISIVAESCQHPEGSARRQKGLTQIIRQVRPKLWHENTPYYEDALQQTWIYFCRNLCRSHTGKQYDPEQASLVTWLNAYLKRRLQDGFIAAQKQKATTVSAFADTGDGESGSRNLIDSIASRPSVPPMLDRVKQWVETDPDGSLRKVHIEGHPQVNCQMLLLRRLPPETPWKELAAEFGLTVGSLSSFYTRQCLSRLRAFGESEGYL